jgi:hypothetical protein
MSTNIDTPIDAARGLAGRYNGPTTFAEQREYAAYVAQAGFSIPPEYRGNPADVFTTLQDAVALDIPPMEALRELYYHTSGHRGVSAGLMRALIIRAGHHIREVVKDGVVQVSDQLVTLELERCDGHPGGQSTYTLADALNDENLSDVGRQHLEETLYARCTSKLIRRYARDVLHGFVYTPDELRNMDDGPRRPVVATETPTVDGDVVQLLDGLDTMDYPKVRDLLLRARAQGLDGRFAGLVNDRPHTVGQVLLAVAERLRLAEQVPSHVVDPAPGAEPDSAAPGPDPADLPAGEGTLPCGCVAAVVVATGEHVDTCVEYVPGGAWAPAVVVAGYPLPDPADVAAAGDVVDVDGDVFGPTPNAPAGACDCDPYVVMITGHACGRG